MEAVLILISGFVLPSLLPIIRKEEWSGLDPMSCSINNCSVNLRYHGFELLMLIRGFPNRSKTPPTSSMSLNEASRLATTPLTLKLMVNIPIVLATSTRLRAPRKSHLTFTGSSMCPSRRWLQIRWKLRVCLLFCFTIGLELM